MININLKNNIVMKKAIKMMMFVAAATMFFAACDKNDDEPKAGDNQMIYDGKTYQGESVTANVENGYVNFSLEKFAEAFIFEINGNFANLSGSHTYDHTKEDPANQLFFHIFLQSDDVENQIFDFQYQNAPHLWYFLNGDNVTSVSAFTSGTAVTKVESDKVIVEASGTLVNGKYMSFRIVAPKN